ncbi:hypothetical protein HPG69_006564 [Diceros bicornis minor]|uniref:Uncharacterized protein n=1 Tax=Diceros bicornis minor TaxID=77932 RepID=A0A7J7F5T0_DICBM|nr:hypothetical protein HPG69_006564 [Diceros bicornis minor]
MRTVISTRLLANCKLTPSPDGTRVGNHKRSNLLDDSELCIKRGCTRAHTRCPEVLGQSAPCRYSASLRSARTRCFYQNLNLQVEVPLWEFSGSYDTSELLTECGGCVGTDGQVASEKRPLGRDRGKVHSCYGETTLRLPIPNQHAQQRGRQVGGKSEVCFQGPLVRSHPGTSLSSWVMSADHPDATFTLSLLRSEPTFHRPAQHSSFISDFAI